MAVPVNKSQRIPRWYFGGVASAMAACCTHPLDLLKVHMQTQQGKKSLFFMAKKLFKSDGVLGFYNGLSASVLRQLTYSMTRFAVYDVGRKSRTKDGRNMPFYEKVALAGTAGAMGGFVGTPADLVNVRMQNDVKLAPEQRRGYKNGFDGLYRVFRQEGVAKMFSGATMATSRAVCVTGGIATFLTMPLDVMKTRMMNAPPGTYKSILACAKDIAVNGPMGFFKGFMPAFVRLGPHTVLTFMFLEQIRMNFGDDPPAAAGT
ncbi:DIC-like protein [Mya arenaria]|uniref:DIC-like protein n=1 Tax=Mya arenaria TaxID=6604 RepID=A0ABY7DID0_MYAAR|nr:DIC-like protein [Mya arenaria]